MKEVRKKKAIRIVKVSYVDHDGEYISDNFDEIIKDYTEKEKNILQATFLEAVTGIRHKPL